MELGIIGLARSGKSSLFNAVTRGAATIGEYTSATAPNVGTVRVPDPRVNKLADIFQTKKTTFAEIRWIDYPVSGFGPDGPGAHFVAELAQLDAVVHVVRAFEDPAIPHVSGGIDPTRDFEALELELQFVDLALIERRIERLSAEMRSIRVAERVELEKQLDLMQRMQKHIEAGEGLRSFDADANEEKTLRNYSFVTRLPQLLVVNIGEDRLSEVDVIELTFAERHGKGPVAVAALSAKVEAELAMMNQDEVEEFRVDLGLSAVSPLDRVIGFAYDLLGLHSFLTAGADECRAWPVTQGATASEAAGKIHTDLERGFIRAEVAGYEDLVAAGSMSELKKRGQLRTEGKAYVVKDGDVLNILFNV
tara:strand:+ start:300 stop:1391 length:1092 start_codon:yes stop_codon:yes gene_type:complete